MTNTAIYYVWKNMKTRCYNKNNRAYKRYWWRWIDVCEKWIFFKWFYEDMVDGYVNYEWKKPTLDRINNDLNYCKENCKRVSQKTQMNNTRRNKKITIWWIKKNLWQWLEIYWISDNRYRIRVKRWWDIISAITKEKRKYPKVLYYNTN